MMNGIEIDAEEDSFERIVLLASEGNMDKAVISQFFRNNSGNAE
jgi:prophage maintenance system killer protein